MNTKLFPRFALAFSFGLAASLAMGCAAPSTSTDEHNARAQEAVAADNDPTLIWNAINLDGATYERLNHVSMSGTEYWFTLDAGVFDLTTDAPPTGLLMQPAVFNRIAGSYLHTDPEDEYRWCIEPVQGGIWQVVSTGTKVTLTDPN